MVTFIILPCKGENAHGRLLSDEKNAMTPATHIAKGKNAGVCVRKSMKGYLERLSGCFYANTTYIHPV